MTLTKLVNELLNWKQWKEYKTEMLRCRQALQQAYLGSNSLPFVEELRTRALISPYAYELLQSQAGQASHYTVTVKPSPDAGTSASDAAQEQVFIVKRVQEAQPRPDVNWSDEGNLRAADFGLLCTDSDEGRETTRERCSCQYPKSTGCASAGILRARAPRAR